MTESNDLEKDDKNIKQCALTLATQWRAGERRTLVTADWPECTLSQAYTIQKNFVAELSKTESVCGYKAAVSNENVQKMFGATSPASGVLFKSGELSDPENIPLERFLQPILETEIGYKLNDKVEAYFDSLASSTLVNITAENVFEYVDSIIPMVEIADVGFSARLTSLVDLVAANTAFGGYIFGESLAITDVDTSNLDNVEIHMTNNGEPIGTARGGDTTGGQAEALAWLINKVQAIGYLPKKGDYLMTGSLGKVYPGKIGSYEAIYSGLGSVNLTLK